MDGDKDCPRLTPIDKSKRVFEKFREVRIYANRLTIIRIMAM